MILVDPAVHPMARLAPKAALLLGVVALLLLPAWAQGRLPELIRLGRCCSRERIAFARRPAGGEDRSRS